MEKKVRLNMRQCLTSSVSPLSSFDLQHKNQLFIGMKIGKLYMSLLQKANKPLKRLKGSQLS
ncbi:MAG: hypothetical protein KKD86_13205, partial [Bacteroidetes bacterium]|nr:hypothetical protein [Bacteroidota bacterium]